MQAGGEAISCTKGEVAQEIAGVGELVTLITELQSVVGGPGCGQGKYSEAKERFGEG